MAGLLAFLSLAKLLREKVVALEAGIERLANWLSTHRSYDKWGVNWGKVYQADETIAPLELCSPVWCYGTPGIARALWLAGEALQHEAYRKLAIEAMEAVYRKSIAERWIDNPSLCHGLAGLLQITLRFAHDTELPLFHEATQELAKQLISLYEPESLLGYRVREYRSWLDRPELLTGTAGIALTLLAASQEHEPTWDRLLLLS